MPAPMPSSPGKPAKGLLADSGGVAPAGVLLPLEGKPSIMARSWSSDIWEPGCCGTRGRAVEAGW
jgi:hypothetical protein